VPRGAGERDCECHGGGTNSQRMCIKKRNFLSSASTLHRPGETRGEKGKEGGTKRLTRARVEAFHWGLEDVLGGTGVMS